MCAKGMFKRFLPFFLTFATGLFVASFFISIPRPGIGFNNRGSRRFHAFQELKSENQQLREENDRLREELGTLQNLDPGTDTPDGIRSIERSIPPAPPAPPARPRVR